MRWIKSLEIFNCYTYEHALVEFVPGTNIIMGDTGKGKSGIIKTIIWVMTNNVKIKDLMRRGQESAMAIMTMSDGIQVIRLRDKKKNEYTIKDAQGNVLHELESVRDSVPKEVQNALGTREIYIDIDQKLFLNYRKQMDVPFLLGKEDTGSVKAKTIGSLKKTNLLDAAERDIQKDVTRLNAESKALEKQLKEVDKELEEFQDFEERLQRNEAIGKKIEELKTLDALRQTLQKHQQRLQTLKTNKQKHEKIIDNLQHLSFIEGKLIELEQQNLLLMQLRKSQARITSCRHNKSVHEKWIIKLTSLPEIENKVKQLEEQKNRLDRLKKSKETLQKCRETQEHHQAILLNLTPIGGIEYTLGEIETLQKTLHELTRHQAKIKTLRGNKLSQENKSRNLHKMIEQKASLYGKMLGQLGKCPICTHDIGAFEIEKAEKELKGE